MTLPARHRLDLRRRMPEIERNVIRAEPKTQGTDFAPFLGFVWF